MTRIRLILSMALGVGGLLTLSAASVLAADPAPSGTGIVLDGHGPAITPAYMGYTNAYKTAKEAAATARVASFASSGLSDGSLAAAGIPSSATLGGFVDYHQKTNYNCVDAIGQSILHRDFDIDLNDYYIKPSVKAKQGDATQASGTIAKGMKTTTAGTDERDAFAWMNSEYARNGSSWRYVGANFTSLSAFQSRLVDEIYDLDRNLYVRVNLTSSHYAWHQTTFATHATSPYAYTQAGVKTTIADPFTHVNSSKTCVPSPYTATPDISCSWVNYSTSEYYLAKDVTRSDARGTLYPVYW